MNTGSSFSTVFENQYMEVTWSIRFPRSTSHQISKTSTPVAFSWDLYCIVEISITSIPIRTFFQWLSCSLLRNRSTTWAITIVIVEHLGHQHWAVTKDHFTFLCHAQKPYEDITARSLYVWKMLGMRMDGNAMWPPHEGRMHAYSPWDSTPVDMLHCGEKRL